MYRSITTLALQTAALWLAASLFSQAAQPGHSPPWKGQYKIKPDQPARLTEADVIGPDGGVYPNWTKIGVQGGIPRVEVVVRIEEFGGRADDDKDDSAALDRACQAAGQKGGGAVLLGEGMYHLDRPVTIRYDGVVIRGRGPGKTKIIFRYALPRVDVQPPGGITFFGLESRSRIGKNTPILLHCRPAGLESMAIEVGDGQGVHKTIHQWKRGPHSGNTFATSITGRAIVGRMPDGLHSLRGVAYYQNGSSFQVQVPVLVDSKFNDTRPVPDFRAAIVFAGKGYAGPPVKLAQDGRRGDRTLVLENASGLVAGDRIHLEAPATDRWKALVQDACKWGRYREYELQVEKIEGNRITVSQPLRLDFPTIDGSFIRKVVPIQHCGVEDLFIEETENLWISSVLFSHGWNCWARGVTVKKCGRFPVYGSDAKWCEIRDCLFDDAWFKGGGGTAYAGWDACWDCLMENVETYKLRHGPLFQWAASGNVIRKSTFHESDAQWHAGWTNENLIEQCVVESAVGNGGYGFGMWASPPDDTAHGPNGPRNVVYNCDIRSPKVGLWMGGMNENWLILYNRFQVEKGNGVLAKTASFDHILRGNVFALNDSKSAMVHLATPDCIGLEVLDNRLYGGSGQMVTGKAKPAVMQRNQVLPLSDAPRPKPAVPSIYEWQHMRMARATNQVRTGTSQVPFRYIVVDAAGPVDPWLKTVGDLNGDGRTDLVVGGHGREGLVWYENPAWKKHVIDPEGHFSTDAEIADVDRDGKPDIICITDTELRWYRSPDWRAFVIDKRVLHDIEVADLDGDGKIDIVGRDQGEFGHRGDRLHFYKQQSPTEWSHREQEIPNGEGLRVADIDGDGRPDVVIETCWYRNPGDIRSGPWPKHSYTKTWTYHNTFVAVGDLNGDGRTDVVLAPSELKGGKYRISWFEAPADPRREGWKEHVVEDGVETVQHFISVADVDLDGALDIVAAAMHQGTPPQEIKLYLNQDKGSSWTKQVIATTGSHSMRLVDLHNDGRVSLFGANHQGQKIELWENLLPPKRARGTPAGR